MTPFQQRFVAGLCMGGIGLIVGVSVFRAPRVGAAPFTSNFDDLIADLQSRATVLSNSTGKVQQQQFKTIEKVLKTLDGKNSTSLATDIQNLGNVSKTLIKAFPTDYTPPGSSLLTNTDTALDGLLNDVQATINTTQSNADLLATSTCKTKAQSSINTAQSQLDAASSATDIPTEAKLLGTALKTELKAEKAVAKCPLGGTGGGGTNTNDFVEATITGDFANSFRSSLLPPVATVGDLGVLVNIGAGEPDFGGTAMSIEVRNVTTTNTYPIDLSSDLHRNSPSNTFYVTEGEITFTTFDLTNRLLAGTFDYTATNSVQGGMITVTNGVFHFDKIQFVGGTP
ncbi:MAG TPA: hypothetical protein VMP11_06890 [Verrucomicrobiae bacterium]|nr:hypothetical protein [Verrucomicrobiae bacterium]